MDRIKRKPIFLTIKDIDPIVIKFLKLHHYNQEIPVPLEQIVEIQLGFNIIPTPQLRYRLGIEGFIIPHKKEIYIDQGIYEHPNPKRYYSTLAHEIGHYVLHQNYMKEFKSENDYIGFLKEFDADWLNWIEAQAWNFARLLLIPSSVFPKVYTSLKGSIESSRKINLQEHEENNPDIIAELLAPQISEQFQVSKDLARYRLLNYLLHKI